MKLKDKKKLLKPRQDNDLLFLVLMSGGSLSDYHDMRDNPLESTQDIKPPTEDDILSSWILGKDEEMNQYKCGGHLKDYGGLNPNNYRDNFGGTYNNPNFGSSTNDGSALNDGSIDASVLSSGSGVGVLGKYAGAAGSLVGGLGNYMTWNDYERQYLDVIGDASKDPLERMLGNIGGSASDNAIDKIEAERLANEMSFANSGNSALKMQEYNQYMANRGDYKRAISDKEWYDWVGDISNSAGTGAMYGASIGGGWGALAGAVIGAGAGIYNNIAEMGNRKALNNEFLKYNIGLDQNQKRFDTSLTNTYKTNIYNQLTQPYACGGKMKHRYDIGGYINSHFDNFNDDLIKIQSGGTHQENSNQGVLVSVAPDGQPNLVEEGETIKEFADGGYVFSDRIVAEEEILKNHLLNTKWAGKTYADISKELDKIIAEHKFDEASQRTFEEMTKRLQESLEDQKFQEKQKEVEQFVDSLSDEQKQALEEEMVAEAEQEAEAQAQAEQAAQELVAQEQVVEQQPTPEEQAAIEEQAAMQAQEQPQMSPYDEVMSRALITDAANQGLFGRGGHMAQDGLKLDEYGNVLPEVEVTSTYIPQGEYFKVDDGYLQSLDRNAFMNGQFNLDSIGVSSNRNPAYTRSTNMQFTYIDGVGYVPVSESYQRQQTVAAPMGSAELFGNNLDRRFGRYDDTNIPVVELPLTTNRYSLPTYVAPWETLNPISTGSSIVQVPIQNNQSSGSGRNPRRKSTPQKRESIDTIPQLTPIGLEAKDEYLNIEPKEIDPITGMPTPPTDKELRKAGWKKNKDGEWTNEQGDKFDYSTWLRYAPAIGSGLQALSDALGITNKNDYTNPNMFQRSINSIPNVGFTPIGGYRTFMPLDTLTASNINRSATEAARRAAINNSSGNASAALAALDAMNQQENNALGNLYIQAQQYNNQMEQQVALHNLRINQINASMSMTAQEKNQAIAAEKARLNYNLAQMRQQIENANDIAKSQNYTNLMTNLGNIGRENFIMNQVNSNMGLYYGVDRNGNAYYKSAYNDLSNEEKKVVDDYIKNEGLTIKKK